LANKAGFRRFKQKRDVQGPVEGLFLRVFCLFRPFLPYIPLYYALSLLYSPLEPALSLLYSPLEPALSCFIAALLRVFGGFEPPGTDFIKILPIPLFFGFSRFSDPRFGPFSGSGRVLGG